MTRPCFAIGCDTQVGAKMAICPVHWGSLSFSQRAELRAAIAAAGGDARATSVAEVAHALLTMVPTQTALLHRLGRLLSGDEIATRLAPWGPPEPATAQERRQQAECDAFNARHPLGSQVRVERSFIIERSDVRHGPVTAPAQILPSSRALVVWVGGEREYLTDIREVSPQEKNACPSPSLK